MLSAPIATLANDIAEALGADEPTRLFDAYDEGDRTDIEIRRALTKVARFLHRYWDWDHLQAEHSFVSIANGAQTGALPADIDGHRIIPGSMLDTTIKEPVLPFVGWQQYRLWSVDGLLLHQPRYVIRGSELYLASPHPAGSTIEYSYVRKWWGQTASAEPLARLTADTDRIWFEDELLQLGCEWIMRHADGDADNIDYQTFESAIRERQTQHADHGILDMSGGLRDLDDLEAQYPATPWGQSV